MEGISLIAKPFFFDFVEAHRYSDPVKLMLEAHRYPEIPMPEAVQQILARQKAKTKLPTWHAHREVMFPPALAMEQCSSEATALFKAGLVQGSSLVDLTGGLGVDAYFMAKSFAEAHYVERQPELCALAHYNFPLLGGPPIMIHQGEAFPFLSSFSAKAEVVYLDPARRDAAQRKVFKLADCEPDLRSLMPLLVHQTSTVLLKTSPLLDIDAGLSEWESYGSGVVREVIVLAVDNECKEVLFLWQNFAQAPSSNAGQPTIRAVDLTKAGPVSFTSSRAHEAAAKVEYAFPQSFIYEPNAAILKAGAFKSVAEQFGLQKLHPNTHLYTSGHCVANFPGRTFNLLAVSKLDKKALSAWLPDGCANLTVRNFPLTVAQIRQKTGLREGGDHYLFATTLMDQSRAVLVCQKVGATGQS